MCGWKSFSLSTYMQNNEFFMWMCGWKSFSLTTYMQNNGFICGWVDVDLSFSLHTCRIMGFPRSHAWLIGETNHQPSNLHDPDSNGHLFSSTTVGLWRT